MEFDQTQPLSNKTRDQLGARQIYRCPCGTDVEIDPQAGGKCAKCERVIPGSVTRMSMTMSLSDVTKGFAYAEPMADDGPDQLIGKTLGHFEIIEPIGRGGMGQVYRALDTSLQRYVAVKVLRGDSNGSTTEMIDTKGQQRLMHEAVAQARVNHPNIVTIYYVGREDEVPFLAMELIDGYDASDLIKQGEVPYETLCSIAIKITHALDVASETGIVHADIKPQNLLILKDGNVKLSDFGMARLDQDDRNRVAGGTPNYLAPEMLTGGESTVQSDMYALGVTLFELTFGRLPVELQGSTLDEWSKTHSNAKIEFPTPWPDHLPEKWRDVLLKLLQQDPTDRFQDYESLGKELNLIMPVRRRSAFLLARSIAWLVDLISIALVAIPIALFLAMFSSDAIVDALAMLPGLTIYTAIVHWWRQSVGRELVHVKIVNQYSLAPTRKKMLLREIFRMQILWWASIGKLLGLFIPYAEGICTAIGLLISVADFGYTATFGRGTSIHDKLFRTQAVVGSDSN